MQTSSVSLNPLAAAVGEIPNGALERLRKEALGCRACPLWRNATQTVFGEGPARASIILVGEQPGNLEDQAGRPFVGPAGSLLQAALVGAGLSREKIYITNVVKHFKFEQRGKARLHQRATAAEQAMCRRWLAAEILTIDPLIVVALGAMAAQTLFGADFRISKSRGNWVKNYRGVGLATWHPAAVLRAPDHHRRHEMEQQLTMDLASVQNCLARAAQRVR
jgi:uracil-DNA glycosylase